MLIVIIHWPADPDRGQEVYGPFEDESAQWKWANEITAAGEGGDPLLKGTHFTFTRMDPPFEVQR